MIKKKKVSVWCLGVLLSGVIFASALNEKKKDFVLGYSEESVRGQTMIRIDYKTTRGMAVEQVWKQNSSFTAAPFNGGVVTLEKGLPEVPSVRTHWQLRENIDYQLVVTRLNFREVNFSGDWLPSRGLISRNTDPGTVPYQVDQSKIRAGYFPQEQMVAPGNFFLLRDVRGMEVTIYPVIVDQVNHKARLLQDASFELRPIKRGTATNPLPSRSLSIFREDIGLYRSLFANFRWDHEINEGSGSILVIHTARDAAAIQPYIDHKESRGFTVYTEQVATGSNVKTTIQTQYASHPDILYVQLVGDWADIQCDVSGTAPMDPFMGAVAGSDNYIDLCIGRFSCENSDQLTIQINKTIQYEQHPGLAFWKNGLGIGSGEGSGSGDDGEADYEHMDIIKENKLLPGQYDSIGEIYTTGAAADVANAVNAGLAVINYCGHGSSTSWSTSGFSSTDVNALTNSDRLPFIFSVACLNGTYHSGTCFAEAWLRKQNGGAVGALMATISQPWTPPMRGQDYINDMLTGGYSYTAGPGDGTDTDHGKTTLGGIIFNAMALWYAQAGDGDLETIKTWILFGDSSLKVIDDAYDHITRTDCLAAILSNVNINASDNASNEIPAGASVLYKTSAGRYGKFQVQEYAYNLKIRWTTYNTDGSVYASGSDLVIRGTWSCDLDAGVECSGSSADGDFFWQQATSVERYITPKNGAIFGFQDPVLDPVSYNDIRRSRVTTAKINGSDNTGNLIPAGTVLVYRTNEGRLGKMKIEEYGYNLKIHWKTFANSGSVYSMGRNLVIRGTWLCDLDLGVESNISTATDFWWEQVDSVVRYLTPKNGARFGFAKMLRQDLLGNWPKLGVWNRNSDTGVWSNLVATEAKQLAAGDMDGDGIDDLAGWWDSGIWVHQSSDNQWLQILNSDNLLWLTLGDLTGDARQDIIGSWTFGVWTRDSASGSWSRLHDIPADQLVTGDLDGDNRDDLVGVWDSGIWTRYASGKWAKILDADGLVSSACADLNGDGRDDFLGSWTASGIWVRDSASGKWGNLYPTGALQVAAGDLNGGGSDDLLGVFKGYNGVYLRASEKIVWTLLVDTTPTWMATGRLR